jgi:Ca2+-binding RTX toxin-like protein
MTNTAPVLNNNGIPKLLAITEDLNINNNTGTLISEFVNNIITDANTTDPKGIAVNFVDNSNGTWQYSLPGNTTWTGFDNPGLNAARLLPSTAKIRFLPNSDFAGTSDINFYAWDQTSGSAGGTANLLPTSLGGSGTGGSTAFSSAYEGATITVNRVNDTAPTLTTGTANNYAALNTTSGSSVTDLVKGLISDRDKDPQGIAVIEADNTNGKWQYSADGGINWTDFGTVSATSATVLNAGVKLYDGSSSGLPNSQGWLKFGTSPAISSLVSVGGTQSVINGGTKLDSITSGVRGQNIGLAGYSNHNTYSPVLLNEAFPILDAAKGFSLNFEVKINSENHTSDDNQDGIEDRAGFSVIVVTSDKTKAIELGFWNNEIWAQTGGSSERLFTHSSTERAFRDTTQSTRYSLAIQGNTYKLFAADASTPILTGNLRDYTAFDHTTAAPSPINSLPFDPYETPNFLFFGDNTTSARAISEIKQIELQTNNRVRFVSNSSNNTATTLKFRAWDGTNGSSSGTTGVNTSENGGITAFSSQVNTATVTLNNPNIIEGTDIAESILGTNLSDLIFGKGGNDLIFGRRGNDEIYGGNGNDIIYGDFRDPRIRYFRQVNDIIHGDAGDDILFGGYGNDKIYGEIGNDFLYGESGNDLLDGGSGNDILVGGGGSDQFVIARDQGTDTIVDFAVGIDLIALAGGLTYGNLTFTQLTNGTSINVGNQAIAILNNVNSASLTPNSFITL